MGKDLIPVTASLTQAAKNVIDVSTTLLSFRKKNKLISAGEARKLEQAILQALEAERQAQVHKLMMAGRSMVFESFAQYEPYANTPMGDFILESVRQEAKYMMECVDDYYHATRWGGVL